MNHPLTLFLCVLLGPLVKVRAAEIKLVSPLEHQVVQRTSLRQGTLCIAGTVSDSSMEDAIIEARLIVAGHEAIWQPLHAKCKMLSFESSMDVPAGGWYQLEIRAILDAKVIAQTAVQHVGIGELFVVAGQSNSANHGEERQTPESDRIVAFDGKQWQPASDPQPGASGSGGSFMPAFGDEIVKAFDVPVGFIACGIGATSVREWLPKGTTISNPPTIESRVQELPGGQWECKGDAFSMLVTRAKAFEPDGFRAVLWHQGESDANQRDPSRTLSGEHYREYLERVIRELRREIQWDVPWFVAQVSYHIPGDESSPDIRAAQASLWKDGIALEGPDSDALGSEFRENNGQGVHFSSKGLREHGKRWAEKVAPWLEQQLREK